MNLYFCADLFVILNKNILCSRIFLGRVPEEIVINKTFSRNVFRKITERNYERE